MKKVNSVNITRYASGKFYVDIVETATMWEAWLGHKRYGVSELMFGIQKKDADRDLFELIVSDNLPAYKWDFELNYIEMK